MSDSTDDGALIVHAVVLAVLLPVMVGGCARTCYRQRADADAYRLIENYNGDPRWALPNYSVYVSPESRMFDPNSPDHPPMPPDDPASHSLMHNVDCKRGYPYWHSNGDVDYVENPRWLAGLPRDPYGRIVVDADASVRLALLHSPEYQRQLEELYLSALDVSFERFRFDTQFFGGFSTFYTADGPNRPGSGGESSSTISYLPFTGNRGLQARRLFSTGGELVVGFANSIVWQFAGPDTQAANTILDFSLVQPLLRLGGRDQVMERLTVAERSLLANVRQMERYRQGYYVQLVTGRFGPEGPTRRGGFFGGAGLEGFSGVGGGGFGRVGGFAAGFFGANFGFAGGAGAGQAGGFLGLLQSQQAIRNQRSTIAALRSSVSQLESFFRAGRIDYFQVELARQALINSQSQLLNLEQAFQTSLDDFKTSLGLPPQIELTLDEKLVEPFELIETDLVTIQNKVTELQETIGRIIVEILERHRAADAIPPAENDEQSNEQPTPAISLANHGESSRPTTTRGSADRRPGLVPPIRLVAAQQGVGELTWSPLLAGQLASLQRELKKASDILLTVARTKVDEVQRDVARLQQSIEDRTTSLDRLQKEIYPRLRRDLSSGYGGGLGELGEAGKTTPLMTGDCNPLPLVLRGAAEENEEAVGAEQAIPVDADALKRLPDQLFETLGDVEEVFQDLEKRFQAIENELAKVVNDGSKIPPDQLEATLRDRVLLQIPNVLNELSANILSLTLVQARARTESVSLLTINMTWQNALAVARRSRLDWMNARASLVDAWRLVQFNADSLESDLNLIFNGDIGNLGDNPFRLRSSTGRLRVGFEFDAPITRLAERNQYRQALIEYQQARRAYYEFEDNVTTGLRSTLRSLDVNQLNFEYRRVAVQVAIAQVELARLRLQEPPQPGVEFQFSSTTARDLVSALSDLLVVQNDFLSVWTNQEVLRRVLDLDMGTMQLDQYGLWVDPGAILDGVPIPGCENGIEPLPPVEEEQLAPLPAPEPESIPAPLLLIDPAAP